MQKTYKRKYPVPVLLPDIDTWILQNSIRRNKEEKRKQNRYRAKEMIQNLIKYPENMRDYTDPSDLTMDIAGYRIVSVDTVNTEHPEHIILYLENDKGQCKVLTAGFDSFDTRPEMYMLLNDIERGDIPLWAWQENI